MSVFSKIKEAFVKSEDKDKYLSGLDRSKKSFGDRMRALSNNFHGIDDDLLEQIMVILLESDVGIHTAQKIVDAFESNGKHIKDYNSMLDYLISILYDFYDESSDEPIKMNEEGPTVILMVGVNGSGKHNNWSMSTDDGQNLLDPGSTPMENMQFLTFLCAVLKGVDEYASMLRISTSSAGNDHRLGANEAPPAIISIFMGEELQGVLDALENNTTYKSESREFKIGVHALPDFPKDSTDRNRTSPFAFTGNRFEFRMVGSADNIACPNHMLNTIVAGELCEIADAMEKVAPEEFEAKLKELLVSIIKEHKRIIFNGDGYSDEWVAEAERRGLPNYKSTVDCVPHYADEKNVALLEKFGIFTKAEIDSRVEILLDNYSKTINIESLTMIDMAKKKFVPAALSYCKELCDSIAVKKSLGIAADVEQKLAEKITALTGDAYKLVKELEDVTSAAAAESSVMKMARAYRDNVFAVMGQLRACVDELEVIMPAKEWPVPAYSDIIFNV